MIAQDQNPAQKPQVGAPGVPAPMTPPAPMPVKQAAAPSVAPAGHLAPSAPTPVAGSTAPQTPSLAPATQSFGPGNDLRATQINPTATPQLAAAQGNLDQATSKLTSGPDRFQLAQDRFNTFAQQSDPAFQASIRAATQKAAANGAIGQGELGTTYGNLALEHTRDLGAERSNLFNNALEGTIGDNRANVGLLSGLEQQQYGQDLTGRNELRGERGYQVGQEQSAYDRSRQGIFDQDALTNSAFGRGQAQLQAGEAGNPAGVLASIYGSQSGQAQNATSGLLQSIYGQQIKPPQIPGMPQPPLPPGTVVNDPQAGVYG